MDTKITDYESGEKNKVCSTCDRPADSKEYKEKIEQKKEGRKLNFNPPPQTTAVDNWLLFPLRRLRLLAVALIHF